MKIYKFKVNQYLIFAIFSLTFLGFYAITLFLVNVGMSGYTRYITIPIRGLISLCFIILILLRFRHLNEHWQPKIFFLFSVLYLYRIYFDYVSRETYYLSFSELILYFLSFAVIPFLSLSSYPINERHLRTILNSLIFSGFIFSFLAFVFYSKYIGQVERLSSSIVDEAVVSPLILSYCSTLIIGVNFVYLLYNKSSSFKKIIAVISILLSSVPFFLGASRGALIALFIPFLFMIFSGKSIKSIFFILYFIIILIFVLFYLDEAMGSGLLNRFLGITKDIEDGDSSASRLLIWESSFNQFLDHPFTGDTLRVNGYKSYPHNIFLEVLQTMGIMGFLPFFMLVLSALKFCIKIFKQNPEYSWVAVIFIQSLIQSLFSGAIYTAAWFWTGMSLIFTLGFALKKKLSK